MGDAGLWLVDVTHSDNPTTAGRIDTPGDARDVAVSDGLACVADGKSGLRIIDVSDPTHPSEKSFFDTPDYAYGVGRREWVGLYRGWEFRPVDRGCYGFPTTRQRRAYIIRLAQLLA